MDPADAGGLGGESGHDDIAAEMSLYAKDGGGEGKGADEGGGQSAAESKTTPVPFDASAFGKTFASEMAKHLPKPAAEQKQMSQEEFRKISNYHSVTPEKTKQFAELLGVNFGDDPNVAQQKLTGLATFLQELVDGSSKHAFALSLLDRQNFAREIDGRYGPIVETISRQEREGLVKRVVEGNKGLKTFGDGATNMVNMAIQSLNQAGYDATGKDDPTIFNDIYKQIETIARFTNKDFSLQSTGTQNGGGRASRGAMPGAVNGAGGSGGSDEAETRGKQSPAQRLYGSAKK